MKTFTLFFLATIISVNPQKNNSILFEQLTINGFSIEQTANSLTTLLGSPNSIGNYENEIDKETWEDYKYSGNSFYFFNNNMVSFALRNDTFYFYNSSLKVGLDISSVNSVFPNSFANKYVLNNLGFIIIDVTMQDGSVSDTFVVLNYNPTTNIITSINLGSK
jgi:hypothetical protein